MFAPQPDTQTQRVRPSVREDGFTIGLFNLPPDEFVRRAATVYGFGEGLDAHDQLVLSEAIRNGTNRIAVIEAIERLAGRDPATSKIRRSTAAAERAPDRFALVETLAAFAPKDDPAFLAHAFDAFCGRKPNEHERLEFEFDLRRGAADRVEVVRRIAALARATGHDAVWDSLDPTRIEAAANDAAGARVLPPGLVVDDQGRETLVFAREVPGMGWMVGPQMLRQPLQTIDGGWRVGEGWLLVGPKRTLAAGTWQIDLDLVQSNASTLTLDLVANSGLDVLQRLTVRGAFCGCIIVEIGDGHRFCELRLEIGPHGDGWLRPRNIAMRQV